MPCASEVGRADLSYGLTVALLATKNFLRGQRSTTAVEFRAVL